MISVLEAIDAAETISATPGTSTARSAFTATGAAGAPLQAVWVTNETDQTVFVKLGDSSVQATTADFPILKGDRLPLKKGAATHIAYITASAIGSGKIYASPCVAG